MAVKGGKVAPRKKPSDGKEFARLVRKVRLEPNREQAARLESHFGAERKSYNTVIAEFNRQGDKENPVPEGEKFKNWSSFTTTSFINKKKKEWDWHAENSKFAYESGAESASDAIVRFFKGQCRYPRYKKRGDRASYTIKNGNSRLDDTTNRLWVPRIGYIKITNKMKKLRREARKRGATPQQVTISMENGVYYASIVYRYEREPVTMREHGVDPRGYHGVDLNVNPKTTVVVADASGNEVTVVETPRSLKKATRELKNSQRRLARKQGPRAGNKKQPKSKRYLSQERTVAKKRRRVNGIVRDWRHQVSRTIVNQGNSAVTLETLSLKAMMKGFKGVRRHQAVLGLGILVDQVIYKAAEVGVTVERVDRYYPSSKKCSNCDLVKAKLGLNERWYHCGECGYFIHRDLNAGSNLAIEGYLVLSETGGLSVRLGTLPRSESPRYSTGVIPYLASGLGSPNPTTANHSRVDGSGSRPARDDSTNHLRL